MIFKDDGQLSTETINMMIVLIFPLHRETVWWSMPQQMRLISDLTWCGID